jgi:hypothetical protein
LLPQYNSVLFLGDGDDDLLLDLLEGEGDGDLLLDLLEGEGDGDLLDLEGGGPHSRSNFLYIGPPRLIFLLVSGFIRGLECQVEHLSDIYLLYVFTL